MPKNNREYRTFNANMRNKCRQANETDNEKCAERMSIIDMASMHKRNRKKKRCDPQQNPYTHIKMECS